MTVVRRSNDFVRDYHIPQIVLSYILQNQDEFAGKVGSIPGYYRDTKNQVRLRLV